MNLDLDLLESVALDRLHHLFRGLLVDPLLEAQDLAGPPQTADFDLTLVQVLHRNASPRELLADHLKDGRQAIFVIGLELDRPAVPVEFHRAVRAFEVITGGDFFACLIHCVVDFLEIDAGRDIERTLLGHGDPSLCRVCWTNLRNLSFRGRMVYTARRKVVLPPSPSTTAEARTPTKFVTYGDHERTFRHPPLLHTRVG